MIALPRKVRVWAHGRPTDLRTGYNGLVGMVKRELGQDPLGGDLFLFVSRRRDRTTFAIPITSRRDPLPMASASR
jgi:hypothetical protein